MNQVDTHLPPEMREDQEKHKKRWALLVAWALHRALEVSDILVKYQPKSYDAKSDEVVPDAELLTTFVGDRARTSAHRIAASKNTEITYSVLRRMRALQNELVAHLVLFDAYKELSSAHVDILHGILWCGISIAFEEEYRVQFLNGRTETNRWEYDMCRLASVRAQQRLTALHEIAEEDRIIVSDALNGCSHKASTILQHYLMGACAVARVMYVFTRTASSDQRWLPFLPSEEEDKLHGIDLWIKKRDGTFLPVDIKASKNGSSLAYVIQGKKGDEHTTKEVCERRAKYLIRKGVSTEVLIVRVRLYDGGKLVSFRKSNDLVKTLHEAQIAWNESRNPVQSAEFGWEPCAYDACTSIDQLDRFAEELERRCANGAKRS